MVVVKQCRRTYAAVSAEICTSHMTTQLGMQGAHQAHADGVPQIMACHAAEVHQAHTCPGRTDLHNEVRYHRLCCLDRQQRTVIAAALNSAWSQSPAENLSCCPGVSCSSSLSGTTSPWPSLLDTVSHICIRLQIAASACKHGMP